MAETGTATFDGHRAALRAFLERPAIRNLILGVIIFNAITLGLSTSATLQEHAGGLLLLVDRLALLFFIVELLTKMYAYGLAFFRNPWNIFDTCVVAVGILPQSQPLMALRALRVIRALRLLSVMPQMRGVVQALFDAMPGMGAVIVMLSIVYYVFGVMATILFGGAFPDWFGTLGRSLYSLFQIMTLESWSMGIVRPVMQEFPYAWAFFVPFIVITSFSVLNLFIGLLVNTMQSAVEQKQEEDIEDLRRMIDDQTNRLTAEIAAMRAVLEKRE